MMPFIRKHIFKYLGDQYTMTNIQSPAFSIVTPFMFNTFNTVAGGYFHSNVA